MLDRMEELLSLLESALNTKTKRHIIGGILMSTAFLFGRPVNNYYHD